MRTGGVFNGTGADLYLCIGFVPDWVHLWNVEATTPIEFVWNRGMMCSADCVEGFMFSWNSTFGSSDAEQATKGTGIVPYYGGLELDTTTAGTVTYGEGVYLKPDKKDYKNSSSDSINPGDGSGGEINKWTLGSSANYTGNWNIANVGTYTGEGSKIVIDGREYRIVAITSNGEAANEITLNYPAPSGDINFVGGMYDFKPMISGEVTKKGFMIDGNTTLNANNNKIVFEAGKWE